MPNPEATNKATDGDPRERSCRDRLVLVAAAIRGTCAGTARAVVDHLLDILGR